MLFMIMAASRIYPNDYPPAAPAWMGSNSRNIDSSAVAVMGGTKRCRLLPISSIAFRQFWGLVRRELSEIPGAETQMRQKLRKGYRREASVYPGEVRGQSRN